MTDRRDPAPGLPPSRMEDVSRAARRAAALRRAPARAELLEEAATASRAGIEARRARVIATARPILQSAVAASLAWLVATELVGHSTPFFAPISAVITLGLTVGERRARAVELALGVAVGIATADLLVALIGTGAWQIGVVVALAMVGATLVGGGPLLASQAAASAVLVATLQPPDGAFDFTRAVDAATGAAIGLLVGSILLPVDPLRLARKDLAPVIDGLAAALDHIAKAVEDRDEAEADRAVEAVARLRPEHDELEDSITAAADAARLSLGRRGALVEIGRLAELARHLRLEIADARSLARGVGRAIATGDATPPEVSASIAELAEATRALHLLEDDGPGPAREAALRAAAVANTVLDETGNMSALHIVGQVRLIAVDLLRATGMERLQAQDAVRSTLDPHPP
jgi:Fusaric acid resistance protein-like